MGQGELRPSWSCDLYHLYKLSFPLPKEAPHKNLGLIGQVVSEKKMFENNGHIHVFSPGADNPLGLFFFQLFSPLLQVFPIK